MLPRPQRLTAFKNSVGFKTLGTGLQNPVPPPYKTLPRRYKTLSHLS